MLGGTRTIYWNKTSYKIEKIILHLNQIVFLKNTQIKTTTKSTDNKPTYAITVTEILSHVGPYLMRQIKIDTNRGITFTNF